LTEKAKKAADEYGVLPWWACCNIRNVGKLPWCARAVLSIVMARLMSLKAAEENLIDNDTITGLADPERFRFSLGWLVKQTGLTHDSVTTAKRLLNHDYGVVQWWGTKRPKGRFAPGTTPSTDLLFPNRDFRIVLTPASNGCCWLDFQGRRKLGKGYAKSGQYP
jgi:hypothetical protein